MPFKFFSFSFKIKNSDKTDCLSVCNWKLEKVLMSFYISI